MNLALDNLLADIVRGDRPGDDWIADQDAEVFCLRAESHGVLPLVAARLAESANVPPVLQSRLRDHARQCLAADLLREAEIRSGLAAFSQAGIAALVLKGAHLAYRWYDRPDLRPRLDTDILIPTSARAAVGEILTTLGYEASGNVGGDLLNYQAAYLKRREGLRLHVFDVHWRVANPQVFAGLLAYDELVRDAVPVPELGPAVQGLSPADALLLACVHRVAHHFDSNRLIWLYDIHLIASQLSALEWEQFLLLVERRKVAAVCRRGLDLASHYFRTSIPPSVTPDTRLCSPAAPEASAAYMKPRRRQVDHVADDLLALRTWRDRMQLVREHLFPPRQYMREVYALSSRAPLPLLYATRVVRGAWRWLERRPGDDNAPSVR